MWPDMQPENSQDGAGAHEMQPESESSATTALPAYRITTFIKPIESDADESGVFETGAYESGASGSGAYESGAYEPGAYESGASESGAYEPGAYEPLAYEPGTYESGADESGLAQLSQSRLAAVLEETPDFVGIADVEGDLLFVNAAG